MSIGSWQDLNDSIPTSVKINITKATLKIFTTRSQNNFDAPKNITKSNGCQIINSFVLWIETKNANWSI